MPQVAPYSGAILLMVARSANGKIVKAGSEELDELADYALLAQHLGDGQHEIRSSGTFAQFVLQAEADNLRDQHRDRLTQHGSLGFDSADAPAENAQAVDHRGVRVRADQCVRVGERLARLAVGADEHHARQVLQD